MAWKGIALLSHYLICIKFSTVFRLLPEVNTGTPGRLNAKERGDEDENDNTQ